MKKLNLLSMRMLGIYLLLFAMVCAVATFVENAYSTEMAKEVVYNTHWFEALFDITALSLLYNIVVFKLYNWKKLAIGMFHFAFVVMILGAAITRYTGEEGKMHIREGDTVSHYIMQTDEGMERKLLPFSLGLTEFVIDYYPGSENPSEFKSKVVLTERNQEGTHHEVYMNHILKHEGYRFFQSSYDQDLKGTILSVNHDPWGMGITYVGYALMFLGMLLSLFAKDSRFQALLLELKRSQSALLILVLLSMTGVVKAVPSMDKEVVKEFEKLWVSNNKGRIQPMNTLSRNLLTKVSQESSYEGLSADEVMLSILSSPKVWANEPIILVGKGLGMADTHVSYNALFEQDGSYRYMRELQQASATSANTRNKKDKAVLALTERVSIYMMMMEGEYLRIYPNASSPTEKWMTPPAVLSTVDSIYSNLNNQWLMALSVRQSDKLVSALESIQVAQQENGVGIIPTKLQNKVERLYNTMNAFTRLAPVYASVAILLLYLSIVAVVKRKKMASLRFFRTILLVAFLLHTISLAMRWYISGHAPMSNGYESMILVSWGSILGGMFFAKKSPITLAISTLLAAATLLVAHMNSMNPEITTLVPVLNSYWLSSHVSSITTSYALLSISALMGLFNISIKAFASDSKFDMVIHELTTISKLLMIIGLYLLTIGCFIGAVWANESWGRYWSWDPKETWCLITIVVYSFIIHMHHVPQLASNLAYNMASVWAISSILMTYFGVNYFLGGMHSYAAGEAFPIPKWIFPVIFIMLTISLKAVFNNKKQNKYL
jgi:cytochrome c-type biogenesis protein CcsB